MYDLHTHTTISDGELIPTELVRRAAVLGYKTLAITDHVDASNISEAIKGINAIKISAGHYGVRLLSGVEITHVPPKEIAELAKRARNEGADIVVVHGETVVEPVCPGTNMAACRCSDVDILAHPGLLTEEEACEARINNVALEITSRGGHNRTNGHVYRVAKVSGCNILVNSDTHGPDDLMTETARKSVAIGCGMTPGEAENILSDKALDHFR
ncbi:histidinol phosphate phosphatase domain-containing protein [Methanoplanus sp. FWC-SCC4]|uniref:Histidinol phosphate phosphatase domain-containing protein n=1 Tax=Methanochimaera problematica TaxID=2609417 RepID=A0AA97FBJ7_9EURY|nr:histidinol phosphate phosphatase domain-containing protein [Methanoplanus sp. FWC-SCC4]WOF15527.1 histidinol phosphate phosphatase domain-containing protein [Methanoplanus sp. FWC-SCC4]